MRYIILVAALLAGCSDQTNEPADSTSGTAQTISGPYPAEISAVVSGEFHADDGEGGIDMIWLEGYEDATFYVSSARYDALDIAEGQAVTVAVSPGDSKHCGGTGPCFKIQ